MRVFRDKNGYGLNAFGFILATVGVVVGILLVLCVPVYLVESNVCTSKADAMNRDAYYGFWEGCMVETDDGYFPLDQIRENQ